MSYASRAIVAACLAALLTPPLAAAEPRFEFQKGDRISIIGNTLADRMQHDGWMETFLQLRFPEHELVFRNLGFPGDEIDRRPRSSNFGSPEQWLTRTKTNVVFAMFGYNESFAGMDGIPAFRDRLAAFIDQTLAANYDGQSAPRLVLFSPIAHENLQNPNLPDGHDNNIRLEACTAAMADVAHAKNVAFVDLFHPTAARFAETDQPLTMNGIHLTPDGNHIVGGMIDSALFGAAANHDTARIEAVRLAVVDKNFYWFNLYRTVDGYNVFGGRSKLEWFGQSNADVMQREMDVLNVMASNRDRRIHAVARGGDLEINDSNTPLLLEVKTNKPGPLEDGTFPFLGGVEAIKKMDVPDGVQVNLFASEEQFPDMINPVQMAVDTDGRLWVATWPTYPHWNPKEPLSDKIVILPDEDRDGKADKLVVFADKLNSVTGFEFWGGGVLVAAAPELLFLKDTDGDDRADVRIRMLQGISAEDTHHTANALTIGPDGGLYFSHGIFHVDNMETPTRTFRSSASGVYRFDPRTFEIDFHFPIGPNPHGIAFDQWGFQFASDGTSGTGSYIGIGKGVGAPKQWYVKRVRPVPAIGFLSGSHFPEQFNGNFMICNAIGVLGVLQHRVEYDGADINAVEIEPMLLSSDPNFRPTDVEIAGDGALYVSDWANPLIGHMQHNIRDPNRDHAHGRVYRLTYADRELVQPVKLRGKPIDEVLTALLLPDTGIRYRTRLELSGRDTADVTAAVIRWSDSLKGTTEREEQALLEGLWVLEEHRVPNRDLLVRVVQAKEPRIRAAAVRTLGHWNKKIENPAPMLHAAANDASPLVRAEAVKAAVEIGGPDAAEVVFEVAMQPTDVQLDFVLKYATGQLQLDKVVKDYLQAGTKLSLAARTWTLRNASVQDLLSMEPSEAVFEAVLSRATVPADSLSTALAGLAAMRNVKPSRLAVAMLQERDAQGNDDNLPALGTLLLAQPRGDLQSLRDELEVIAGSGKSSIARRAAYAAWIRADGSAHAALHTAAVSSDRLRDFLDAVMLVPEDDVRRAMYSQVRPLVFDLPPNLKQESGHGAVTESGIHVDYFHPSAKDVAIETLERMTPRASGVVPSITLDIPQIQERDRFALRFTGAIHLDRPGNYKFFTRSDDGSRIYIGDELVVNNDGLHGMSEKSGTIELAAGSHPIAVTYFDNGGSDGLAVAWQGPGFKKQPIPPEKLSVVGNDTLHDAAIRALAMIPDHNRENFNDFASLIKSGRYRASAIRGMQSIPATDWSKTQLRPIADNLVGYLSEMPARYRTGVAATEAIELVRRIAEQLPPAEAEATRNRLDNLDVRVIAIGTVPHRMIYDKETIVVQGGRTVEFRFSNTDNMPHNFAITQPGSMEEVGLLAEATAETPDAMARNYIPKSDRILLASRLLQPGEHQALSFDVPQTAGVYPFVCTYPGHWRRMYGALYVVDDPQECESDRAGYLAAHAITIQDELLNRLQRNTEWRFDDLTASIASLQSNHMGGRSFEVGQHLFEVASCTSCHKLNDKGRQIGPDLAKIDPKRTLSDVLRDVLEPSLRINEKFVSNGLLLSSGKTVTGLVVDENDDVVKLVTNPLAPDKPSVIAKSDIDERIQSKVSLMPQGVLNKLTEEEILDLIAYVFSGGNKQHPLFAGHGDHGH